MRTAKTGAQIERSAEQYLKKHGLRTICRNYRCRRGEIDLIMEDGTYLVFVEVRYRRNHDYGTPLETITAAKQRRIVHAATFFLNERNAFHNRYSRFDAVGVSKRNGAITFDWIKDAFSA